MKKPLLIFIILLAILIIFFGYRHQQDKKFKAEFRSSIQAVPEALRTRGDILPPQMGKFIKLDILVNYPNISYYIDVKGFKEKKLPPEALEYFGKEQGNMVCKSFFAALQPKILHGSKRQQKLFLELLKTENLRADMKLRNAFGEDLYTESAVLAQCPEYTDTVYLVNNN